MSETEVREFKADDGTCEVSDWLRRLKTTEPKAYAKCIFLIKTLKEYGHELGMPYAKQLRDGISELRGRVGTVNYRMLFGFHDGIAVICRGLTKEREVEPTDIDTAVERMKLVKKNIDKYTS